MRASTISLISQQYSEEVRSFKLQKDAPKVLRMAKLEDDFAFSGEMMEMKRYLDMRFEREEKILEGIILQLTGWEGAASTSGTSGTAMDMSTVSTGSDTSPEGGRSSVQSRRHTFVRSAMLKRQIKGQKRSQQVQTGSSDRDEEEKSEESMSYRDQLRALLYSARFNYCVMALIVLNSIFLGVEIDVSAHYGQTDVPEFFGIINMIFVIIFLVENSLKLFTFGCSEFWRGEEWKWNTFDFAVVWVSVADLVIEWVAQSISAGGSSSMRVIRALRLARTLRGVRIIRVLKYFSALRGLLVSILGTLTSLLWTLILLVVIFYVFSVVFTQLVVDYCRFETIELHNNTNAIPECPANLDLYWGDVMTSMHSLFLSITGGINWLDAYAPLRDVYLPLLWLFNLYIVIGFFTILNVVTGVFVNTAIESASADKDIATMRQMQQRMLQMESLREVFQEMANGRDSRVSLGDLATAMDENRLGSFMQSLGISTDDVWTLFMLIDVDDNGVVDIDEFVSGCMHLRGPAQSLQVAKMAYENKVTRQAIKKIQKDVESIRTWSRGRKTNSVIIGNEL